MGWWKAQGTQDIIGDLPLDALGNAVAAIVNEYQSEWGRRPTKSEWEALLKMVLGNNTPEFRCLDEGKIMRVSLDVHR